MAAPALLHTVSKVLIRPSVQDSQEFGIGFDNSARTFEGPVLIEDRRRYYGEDRFRAVEEAVGDILHVPFTWRGGVMRIISVPRANRKETGLWRRAE